VWEFRVREKSERENEKENETAYFIYALVENIIKFLRSRSYLSREMSSILCSRSIKHLHFQPHILLLSFLSLYPKQLTVEQSSPHLPTYYFTKSSDFDGIHDDIRLNVCRTWDHVLYWWVSLCTIKVSHLFDMTACAFECKERFFPTFTNDPLPQFSKHNSNLTSDTFAFYEWFIFPRRPHAWYSLTKRSDVYV